MAKIIKGEKTSHEPLNAFSLDEIQARCQEYINEANQRAAELVEQTREQTKEIKKQAAEIGYRDGRAEGFEKGRQEGLQNGREEGLRQVAEETAGLETALHAALDRIEESREDLRRSAEADLLALAGEVVRRIIKVETSCSPQIVEANVIEAIRLTVNRRFIKVLVHPQNLQQLQQFKPELLARFTEIESLEILEDSKLTPGGAVVTTNVSKVDLDIRTQVDRLEQALFEKYQRRDGSDLLFGAEPNPEKKQPPSETLPEEDV